MENAKKYFLGLDIGTNSVGWCVTDQDYNIVKKRAKRFDHYDEKGNPVYKTVSLHLWGSRLFEEAKDASSRRSARSARRRLARRRRRLLLLQDIFKPEMDKVDKDFFDRLNVSAFYNEDKPTELQNQSLLFKDIELDKQFYHKYPTIYHLRKAMMTEDRKFDIREVYLAIAHIIKYRGNFLKEGDLKPVGTDSDTIVNSFNRFDAEFQQINEDKEEEEAEEYEGFGIDVAKAKELLELFKKESQKSLLLEQEKGILGLKVPSKDIRLLLLQIINGSKLKLSKFFDGLDDEVGDISIDFSDEDFLDKQYLELPTLLGEDKAQLFVTAKELYDFRLLVNILGGAAYLSDAMIDIYNQHHDQLYGQNLPGIKRKGLKRLIKEYAPKSYAAFFRKAEGINYSTYVGMNDVKGKKVKMGHTTSAEDLYKEIKKILCLDKINDPSYVFHSPEDKEEMEEILDLMNAGKYLPRQNSRENGVLPYQLNKIELEMILNNQGKYYPILLEKAPDFNNPAKTSPKIISLLEYKVPYYVGPLTDQPGENHWMVRKEKEAKITPWNFHEVIDEEATEQKFIERMKNSCSYLIGEPTLPANSLLYSEFMLLNEMNNWKINNEDITLEQKEYLINKVYLKKAKPTKTMIEAALKEKYGPKFTWTTKTGGEVKAEDIHANLKPFIDMMNEKGFGPALLHDDNLKRQAEEIIFDITIFEDKKQVENRLSQMNLSDTQKKYFSKLNYSGWGKMSRKLLNGLTTEIINKETGEVINYSIMDLLRETSDNFMQIYEKNDKYSFKKQVEDIIENDNSLTMEDIIDEEYVSPLMKRALRQSLKIVEELKKILKIDGFDSYFIETTRENKPENKGKRTLRRSDQLKDYFKAAKGIAKEQTSLMGEQLQKFSDEDLRGKKLFHYFLQLGKDVYTGEPIELSDLKDYDIDHIIPQAKLKDDSLINTVLVKKSVNNSKQDNYPIPAGVLTEKGKEWVKTLHRIQIDRKSVLMPTEKMDRILRNYPLTEEEEAGFVNRQLTITNQSVKAVCDVLKRIDPNAKIVYSKAGLVSDFRSFFSLLKCRDVNDFHHAHDAYLNIVVGNVYNKVFTNAFSAKMVRENKEYFESMKIDAEHFFSHDHTIYHSDKKIWISKHYDFDKNGNRIESPDSKGTIDLVRKYLSYNDPLVTQMLFTQTGKQGFFNKISIHSKIDGGGIMPLKQKAPFNCDGFATKYGGYNDLTAPYFILVESTIEKGKDKGKHQYSLENIPSVYLASLKNVNEQQKYLADNYATYGLKAPKIILPKLLIRSVIEFHKETEGKVAHCRVGITGKTGNQLVGINLSEFHVDKEHSDYIRSISKALGTDLPANTPKPDIEKYKDSEEFSYRGSSLSKAKNVELFDYICQTFRRPEYALLPSISGVLARICNSRQTFQSLSITDQCFSLLGMVELIGCKVKKADISKLKIQKSGTTSFLTEVYSRPQFSKKVAEGTRFIAQSITGFYEDVLFVVPKE